MNINAIPTLEQVNDLNNEDCALARFAIEELDNTYRHKKTFDSALLIDRLRQYVYQSVRDGSSGDWSEQEKRYHAFKALMVFEIKLEQWSKNPTEGNFRRTFGKKFVNNIVISHIFTEGQQLGYDSNESFKEIKKTEGWKKLLSGLALASALTSGGYMYHRHIQKSDTRAAIQQNKVEAEELGSQVDALRVQSHTTPYTKEESEKLYNLQNNLRKLSESKKELEEQLPGTGRNLVDASTILPAAFFILFSILANTYINNEKDKMSVFGKISFDEMEENFLERLGTLNREQSKDMSAMMEIVLKRTIDRSRRSAPSLS